MKFLKIGLILFLLFEVCFSFYRYQYLPMDGDMGSFVFGYNEVKQDPFGFDVLLHNSSYGGTNRFFAYWLSDKYFKNAPLAFSVFGSPIDSVYLAWSFLRISTQFLLVYLLAVYITGKRKLWDFDVLLSSALIAPLFQIQGYGDLMCIIGNSISYTFFYATAFCSVVFFFLPFFNAAFQRRTFRFSLPTILGLLALVIFNAFNGPLNAPVMLIICSFTLAKFFIGNMFENPEQNILKKISFSIKKIPSPVLIVFAICIVVSLYSLFIGKNNSENLWETMSLHSRYERLWQGIYMHYAKKLGPPLLIIMIILNRKIIQSHRQNPLSETILKALQWFLWIALLYIFLLPLGGYRSYRPYILRTDTLLPVTLGLILFYGLTTFHILRTISFRYKFVYYLLIIGCTLVYVNADTDIPRYNTCERDALEKIANSKDSIVFIENECTIINWGKTLNYKDSDNNTELLLHWGVIKEKKYFYQK
jgi:hypothetical protein